jgi:hypothetical protein
MTHGSSGAFSFFFPTLGGVGLGIPDREDEAAAIG